MTPTVKQADSDVLAVLDALRDFRRDHPHARIDAFSPGPETIHVRVIDPSFARIDRLSRDAEVWPLLERLGDEIATKVTVLLLLAPAEADDSLANIVFERGSAEATGIDTLRRHEFVFHRRLSGHGVWVTVSRPWMTDQTGNLVQSDLYCAAFSIDSPPRLDVDGDQPKFVIGETLRNGGTLQWFDDRFEAAEAGFAEAEKRL